MPFSEINEIQFSRMDQLSMKLLVNTAIRSVRSGFIIACEAVLLGIAIQWFIGRPGAQLANRWQAFATGFVMLMMFVAIFAFVASLFPPAIRITRDALVIEREDQDIIPLSSVTCCRLTKMKSWVTCRISHIGNNGNEHNFEFHIASREMQTQLSHLNLLLTSADISMVIDDGVLV